LNVLLIQLKRIGDLILTVPAIVALRKDFPAARISLIAAQGLDPYSLVSRPRR
jgi:ADP-heptose:LPS heptosyltransferase